MEWADGGAKGSGMDKGKEIREEMNAVKDVMVQNIERVLERGERIDLLVNKTDHMNQTAFAFRQRSAALRFVLKMLLVMVGGGCGGRILGLLL